MRLFKRSDGRSPYWQFVIRHNGKKLRRTTGTADQAEAEKLMRRAFRSLKTSPKSKLQADPAPKPLTIEQALDDYVAELAADGKKWARSARTHRDKTLGLRTFKGRFSIAPETPVGALNAALMFRLRQARRDEGMAAQTIAHELSVIRAALAHAAVQGHPVPTIRWKLPASRLKTRWLTLAEWWTLYDAMDPERPVPVRQRRYGPLNPPQPPLPNVQAQRLLARDLLVALTLCGGRWGEVTRLTVDQVVPGYINLFGYKTGRSRMVPCPVPLAEALERRKTIAQSQGTPYLFPSGRASAAGHRTAPGLLGKAFDRAGLNAPHLVERYGRATPHSLRHTFASWLVQDGMRMEEVQELLGHSTITLTQRYAHLAAGKAVSEAGARLGRIIG